MTLNSNIYCNNMIPKMCTTIYPPIDKCMNGAMRCDGTAVVGIHSWR